MNIGIMVHSHTGNTLFAAKKLQEALAAAGHLVTIHNVSAINDEEADYQKIKLDSRPETAMYDALFFGAPVRGFSLSPVMRAYLTSIGPLSGKRTACFVTQHLPYAWMGGRRALRHMGAICKLKGSAPFGTGVINWSKAPVREKQIEAMAGDLSAALQALSLNTSPRPDKETKK